MYQVEDESLIKYVNLSTKVEYETLPDEDYRLYAEEIQPVTSPVSGSRESEASEGDILDQCNKLTELER